MDGVLRPDLGNVITIGLVAFVLVFLIDRALRKLGFATWTTSGS
jgi:hypothetical protein